jgi:hypothetical protein
VIRRLIGAVAIVTAAVPASVSADSAEAGVCLVRIDAKIKKSSQDSYKGGNEYFGSPPGTSVTRTVPSGSPARYDLKFQNDCETSDLPITVEANDQPPGLAKFVNGNDITNAVESGGKTFASVPPLGHTPRIRLRVTYTGCSGCSNQTHISGQSNNSSFDDVLANTEIA